MIRQWLIPTQQFFVLFNLDPRAEGTLHFSTERQESWTSPWWDWGAVGFCGVCCLRWSGYASRAGALHGPQVCGVFCSQTHKTPCRSVSPEALSLTSAILPWLECSLLLLPHRTASYHPPTLPPTFYTEILNLVQTSIFCLRTITFETSSFSQPPRVEFFFPLQTGDFVTPKQIFLLLI